MARAVIVGAGIGGLAAAVALGRQGWDVTLLERHQDLTAAGAALALWPNALVALRTLELDEQLLAVGAIPPTSGVRRRDGRWLTRIDGARLRERMGGPMCVVERGDLHELLAGALAARVRVHTGTQITDVEHGEDRVHVSDGRSSWSGDLLVAADGANSRLREVLAPDSRLREVPDTVGWRAVVPEFEAPEMAETLGRGLRFGTASVARGTYWYAATPAPAPDWSAAERLAELVRLFAGWHDPIPQLLARTDPDGLLCHPLADLDPLPPMRIGNRVALLGDAAHAMTPNLGQGACQALEDAVTLGRLVTRGDLAEGLRGYELARAGRTAMMVRRSRQAGELLAARGRVTAALRDLMLSTVPSAVMLANSAALVRWSPPA